MLQLNVEGMSCNHCVGAVNKALKELDPNAKVEVNLAEAQVSVESSASTEEIIETLNEAGYPAKVG